MRFVAEMKLRGLFRVWENADAVAGKPALNISDVTSPGAWSMKDLSLVPILQCSKQHPCKQTFLLASGNRNRQAC